MTRYSSSSCRCSSGARFHLQTETSPPCVWAFSTQEERTNATIIRLPQPPVLVCCCCCLLLVANVNHVTERAPVCNLFLSSHTSIPRRSSAATVAPSSHIRYLSPPLSCPVCYCVHIKATSLAPMITSTLRRSSVGDWMSSFRRLPEDHHAYNVSRFSQHQIQLINDRDETPWLYRRRKLRSVARGVRYELFYYHARSPSLANTKVCI